MVYIWFIFSNLDGLEKKKTCHLAHLNGRDGPDGNKDLSFRHIWNSLGGGKSWSVKMKRFWWIVMSVRPSKDPGGSQESDQD